VQGSTDEQLRRRRLPAKREGKKETRRQLQHRERKKGGESERRTEGDRCRTATQREIERERDGVSERR